MTSAIEQYHFEVGIIEDGVHFAPRVDAGTTTYAGTTVRRRSSKPEGSVSNIASKLQGFSGWLSEPFQEKSNELLDFAKTYIAEVQKKQANENRLRNLVQAIVRNPILRRDYGSNKPQTAKSKGFDHLMVDTGQFFKSVKAKAIKNV